MSLVEYRRKRRFGTTPEPQGQARRRGKAKGPMFVVQKHAASRLHYDFRLEHEGVLWSWAVPKGPSLDPADKRLAVQVEDHPLDYAEFEGSIPKGEYGGGEVIVWDHGTWEPEGAPQSMLDKGRLKFSLVGEKLRGTWNLVRTRGRFEDGKNWLLIKSRDDEASPRSKGDVLEQRPESVLSGRTVEQVAALPERVWKDGKSHKVSRKASPWPARLKKLNGATKAPLPELIEPQLATASASAPAGPDWLHEIKHDGCRLLCQTENGNVRLVTRGGHDWARRFPEIATAAMALPVREAWLDGEATAPGSNGVSSFSAIQDALSAKQTAGLVYYLFDLLYLDGYDLRRLPLVERKALLAELLKAAPSPRMQYVDHIEGHGPEFFGEACKAGLEGAISKRANDLYHSGRTSSWLKIKCGRSDELVVGGYTLPAGSRSGFGALLLGEYDAEGRLRYVGRVGTGFDETRLAAIRQRLDRMTRKKSPFDTKPADAGRDARWVKPELVVEVRYAERTADGLLRQASFRGLREDKTAREVAAADVASGSLRPARASNPSSAARKTKSGKSTSRRSTKSGPARSSKKRDMATRPLSDKALEQLGSVRLTSPDKVLDPKTGMTKLDLTAYYAAVVEWVLPHVAGRPLSLVRCPDGVGAECFFQKHADRATPPALERLPLPGEEKDSLVVRDLAGLAGLVQMGVLEIHVWGSRVDRLDRPDRLIFDLDPGEGVPWREMIDATLLVRHRLERLGLTSFVKTTGGKGMHAVAPLDRRHSWDEIKGFARRFGERLAAEFPKRFVATSRKAIRGGRIYVDYLRNGRGATAVAPYSPRAREGAPVAVPLFWDELTPDLDPAAFDVRTVPKRLAALEEDPWGSIDEVRQSITAKARKGLGIA